MKRRAASHSHDHKHGHSHSPAESPESLLDGHNLKKTPFRLALIDYVGHADQPQNGLQIFEGLKKKKIHGLKFDRATVFRNLKTLSDEGIFEATEFGTGSSHYCLKSSVHHHHMFCRKCETAYPIDHCGIAPMIEMARKLGFQVESHRLELIGLCRSCR